MISVKYILYFLFGGIVISGAIYLGSLGRGLLAALVATFPVITSTTLFFLSREASLSESIVYARGLIYFTPAWLAYVTFVIFALPRMGIYKTLGFGLGLYILLALLTRSVITS
jgi:hypothetical protein